MRNKKIRICDAKPSGVRTLVFGTEMRDSCGSNALVIFALLSMHNHAVNERQLVRIWWKTLFFIYWFQSEIYHISVQF